MINLVLRICEDHDSGIPYNYFPTENLEEIVLLSSPVIPKVGDGLVVEDEGGPRHFEVINFFAPHRDSSNLFLTKPDGMVYKVVIPVVELFALFTGE